jgi:hypothetical protein
MTSEEPQDDKCAAQCRDGGYCTQYPVQGAERCRMHGGQSPGGDGAPEGNGNAERHGLTADRDKWFDRHRDEVEDRVRVLTASYMQDAPFGWEHTAKVDKLVEVVIDQVRLQQSNEYLDEFLTEQVIGTTEDGRPIQRVDENPAHMPRARIKRDNIRILKELGILDDPDSAQAESVESLAKVLSGDA